MSITLLIAYASLAIWLYLLLAHGWFWLTDSQEHKLLTSPTIWPDICAVIPARNEADILENTLPSLLNNDYPGQLRIVLVDDRSEDGTSKVAANIAKSSGSSDRLTLVNVPLSPTGWKGKVWAMKCGLDQITASGTLPSYVLFTDADIAYDKGILTQLITRAESYQVVLASLMVRLRCQSTAERWLIPAFVYFFKLLYPFRWVNNPSRKMAAAAGGCMLVRYDALMRAGGIEPIRAALIDDCALGRLMKKQGRIWLGLTQQVHSLRPYPHMNDIRQMVARSAYDQLGYSPLNLLGTLLGLTILYIAPVMLALFAENTAQLLGALSWICMSITFFPILRFYGRCALLCVTLPAIAALYMGFTLDSAIQYLQGKGGLWKGRVQAAEAGNA